MLIHGDKVVQDRAFVERLHAAGLDRVDRVLLTPHDRVVAWSRSSETAHIPGEKGVPGFYLKQYLYAPWMKRLRGFFRGTFFGMNRARAERRALLTLQSVGVPTVRPVAVGERRILRLLAMCFLVTEEVPGAENLTSFMQNMASSVQKMTPAYRRQMCRRLAREIETMHAAGMSHGQLFFRNILIRDGIDGAPEFFFLDAEPIARYKRAGNGKSWLVRELAQLAGSASPFVSKTDWCRFLRAYLNTAKFDRTAKEYIRAISRLVTAGLMHESQRARMNQRFRKWRACYEHELHAANTGT